MDIDQQTWEAVQKHLDYTDEEMKVFKENQRNVDVLSKASALINKLKYLEMIFFYLPQLLVQILAFECQRIFI